MRRALCRHVVAAGVVALLGAAHLAVALALMRHASTPGETAEAPHHWPHDAGLARERATPALVVFAHPRCPCTAATLRELDRIAADARAPVDLTILFVTPPGLPEDWAHTPTWESARRIPGARVRIDPAGAAARRFGARTSGHALLYDAQGALAFSGGVTPARAHEGDSAGRAAILSALADAPGALRSAPVFGCPLFDEPDKCAAACAQEAP